MQMILTLTFHLLLSHWWHPFHVSVCEINHNTSAKSLEITHRIFLDDLEETLRAYSGNPKLDVLKAEDNAEVNRLLKSYFKENFSVSVNGQKFTYNYLGEEREEDVMYCYMEIEGVGTLSSIEVENKVLLDVFPDQMNLVHIKAHEKTRSLRLRQHNEWGEILY